MKFRIFSLSEKWYKIVTSIITIGITLWCFLYYHKLEDKANTFVIGTIYAAFLFIAGLYLSYESNNISNKLYERKNEYIMLKRLDKVFTQSCMTFLNSYGNINLAILSFQVYSGRTNEHVSSDEKKKAVVHTVPLDFMMESQAQIDNNYANKERHYIEELGFEFEPKLQKVEDSYSQEYFKLKASIQEKINVYITDNKIGLNKHGGFFETGLLETNYEEWCNAYVSENSMNKKEDLIQNIYKIIEDHQADLNNLENKKKQLVKYYEKCNKKI